MSIFEDQTYKFKQQLENANNNSIKMHSKSLDDRPLNIEEMMKQRDAEVFNINYNEKQCNSIVHKQLKQFEDKTIEERMNDLMNVKIDQSPIKQITYICTMFDQHIDINLVGVLECYPPIYKFGPGFSFPNHSNEISLPSDFRFNPSRTTHIISGLSFVIKCGDDEFVNNYGNTGHMFIGTTGEFKYIEGGQCIKFNEISTNGNSLYFEYNQKKNVLKFICGDYHLTSEQCEALEGVSKKQMTF